MQPSAAIQPGTPAPSTGGSFNIVLSPDTDPPAGILAKWPMRNKVAVKKRLVLYIKMMMPSGLPSLTACNVAAAAAGRRLDFDRSRGFEAGAQTQARQPRPDQHQVGMAALHICHSCIACLP